MRVTAARTSATNAVAARGLRPLYHSTASSSSSRASSRNSGSSGTRQDGLDAPVHLGPGDRLRTAGVEVCDAALDLPGPQGLDARVGWSLLEALVQRVRDEGTRLRRKTEHALQE